MKTFTQPWRTFSVCLQLVILMILLNAGDAAAATTIRYVNKNATGNGTGTSWRNAYTELADALKWAKQNEQQWNAANPLEVWVAAGTYKPGYSPAYNNFLNDDGRNNTFFMVEHVRLYGGFQGNEGSIAQRNWAVNKTILSGDLRVAGDNTDNCFSVLMAMYISN